MSQCYELMDAEKANFEITRMARLLEVSRSGYYAWVARQAGPPGLRAAARAERDRQVRKVFDASDRTYGAPRVAAQLRRQGAACDKKTVAASMVRQGLEGISPRMFTPVTTIAGAPTHHIPDRVDRCWDSGGLNRVWISDITYLRTGQGWLYLAAVIDAHSRRVIGWAMDSSMSTDLVESALRMAHALRGGLPTGQIVFHADRGTQYTSAQLADACRDLGLLQSMGRTGICWDNAMAESFWAKLKTEFYDRRTWPTRLEARHAIGTWIEHWYNRQRLHSAIGYQPPVEYEMTITKQDQATRQAA